MLANAPSLRMFTHVRGDGGSLEEPKHAPDDQLPHAFSACQSNSYIAMSALRGALHGILMSAMGGKRSLTSSRYSTDRKLTRFFKVLAKERGVSPHDPIHLTYPKTHSLEAVYELLDSYRREHPNVVEEWMRIEREDEWNDDPLVEVHRHAIMFLMEHTKWDSYMALSKAWFDWRGKVRAWVFAH